MRRLVTEYRRLPAVDQSIEGRSRVFLSVRFRPRADRDSSQSGVRSYHDCGQSGVLNRLSILFSKITPGPLAAAERLVSILPHLPGWPSGSFVDIREILDPEAYAKLYPTILS